MLNIVIKYCNKILNIFSDQGKIIFYEKIIKRLNDLFNLY